MNSPNIQSGIDTVLSAKDKRYPCHVNRISQLDDPCLRRLYYYRHDWDKAKPTELSLQGIYETGNILEPVISRIISETGEATSPKWRIVGTQTTTNDSLLKEHQISGTIDGFLQIRNEGEQWQTIGVVDIKTVNPNIYQTLTDYQSLGRYFWTKKWRGQLMLYSLAHNLGRCFLLLVNKTNLYDMRLLDFEVDMAYCDELLAKAKAVNKAIKTDTPPPQINNANECQRCSFFAFCSPNLKSTGDLKMIENNELAVILDRLSELETAADEYADLEKQRDALLSKGQDVICGNWMVMWKKSIKHYKEQLAKAAHDQESWSKTITKLA